MIDSENLPNFKIKIKEEEQIIPHLSINLEKGIIAHKDKIINHLSFFPSGNFVTVANDINIKIWSYNYKLIQEIKIAHESYINHISIKDENTFATCSIDKNINIWNKRNNLYINIIKLSKVHDDSITKIIYYKNNNLISVSLDGKIKIWQPIMNGYQCNTIIFFSKFIKSILLLEDIGITIGNNTKIWSLKNYELIYTIEEAQIYNKNAIGKIDNDRIIIGGYYKNIKILSISEKKLLKKLIIILDVYVFVYYIIKIYF
jgi:WD40 repeat protein